MVLSKMYSIVFMFNIIFTFHNRRQSGRARGLSHRGESEGKSKRQRGSDREKETGGKRQRGRDRGE